MRNSGSSTIVCLLAFSCPSFAQTQEVLASHEGSSHVFRVELISRSQFVPDKLKERCRQLLESYGQTPLIQVRFFTSARQYAQFHGWPLTSESANRAADGYRDYLSSQAALIDYGELLVVHGDAILRRKQGGSAPETYVLRGADPLQLQVSGAHYKILSLFMQPLPARLWSDFEGKLRIELFITTKSALRPDAGERLMDLLASRLPVKRGALTARIREDEWFFSYGRFSAGYAFRTRFEAPPIAEYERTQTLVCSMIRGSTEWHCRMSSVR